MANAANLINFGGSGAVVGDVVYSPTGLTAPSYLPLNNQYASYLVSSYPTLGALYTTPVAAYAATGITPPTVSNIGSSMAYGNGVWVVAAPASISGGVLTSVDGVNWVKKPVPIAITQVAYGNGRFVGYTANGSALTTAYSLDGFNWVQGGNTTVGLFNLSYANGAFFIYRDGAGGGTINISTNGLVWNSVTSGTIPETHMAYGNGTIVVSASQTFNAVGYSKDGGLTWTNQTVAGGQGLAFGNGIFVKMPASGATAYATSPDGITWTARTFPAALNWTLGSCITFGNGVFLAVSATSGTTAYSSPDGINWTLRALPSSRVWNAVRYGGPANAGYFIALGGSATDNIANITLSVAQTSFSLPLIPSIVSNTNSYIKAS